MTQGLSTNIFSYKRPLITSSGTVSVSSSQIESLLDADTTTSAISLTSTDTLYLTCNFDLPVSTSGTAINKASLYSSTLNATSNISFYLSQDGTTYTSITPTKSGYSDCSTQSAISTLNSNQSSDYSKLSTKMYRVRATEGVLRIYDPSLNSWSTSSLGFTLGQGCAVLASTLSSKLYLIPGNGTSNFYELDISSTPSVSAITPSPSSVSDVETTYTRMAFDKTRRRLYVLVCTASTLALWLYDIGTATWKVLSMPSGTSVNTGYCIAYASNIERLILFNHTGTVYYLNPFTLNWNSYSSVYAQVSTSLPAKKIDAKYSELYGYVYVNITSAATSTPVHIVKFNPKTATAQTVTYTVLGDSGERTEAAKPIALDDVNQRAWVTRPNSTNILVSLVNEGAYYVDTMSHTNRYKYLKIVATNTLSIQQISCDSNPVNTGFTENPSTTSYNNMAIGVHGTISSIHVSNDTASSASSATVFLAADGSIPSRYSEISSDQVSWNKHCQNNNLEENKCSLSNSNFNTTKCSSCCSDFSRDSISLGTVASSGTKTVYLRTKFPVTMDKVNQELSLGVGMEF